MGEVESKQTPGVVNNHYPTIVFIDYFLIPQVYFNLSVIIVVGIHILLSQLKVNMSLCMALCFNYTDIRQHPP